MTSVYLWSTRGSGANQYPVRQSTMPVASVYYICSTHNCAALQYMETAYCDWNPEVKPDIAFRYPLYVHNIIKYSKSTRRFGFDQNTTKAPRINLQRRYKAIHSEAASPSESSRLYCFIKEHSPPFSKSMLYE